MHTLYHALVAQDQEIFDRDIQGYTHNTTMLWVVNKLTYKTNLRLHKLACANFFAGKVKLS